MKKYRQPNEKDELFDEVLAFILDRKKVSISAVQRTFGIGYNHAARLLEQMSDDIPSEYYPDLDNLNSGRTAFSISEDKDSTYSNDLLMALDHGKRFTEFDDQLTGAHIAHYHLMDGVIDRQYPIELNSFPLGNSSSVQEIVDAEIIHHVVIRSFTQANADEYLIALDSEDLEFHFLGHHQFIQLILIAYADTFVQDIHMLWQSLLSTYFNQHIDVNSVDHILAMVSGNEDKLDLDHYTAISELLVHHLRSSDDVVTRVGVSESKSLGEQIVCMISLRLKNEDDAI